MSHICGPVSRTNLGGTFRGTPYVLSHFVNFGDAMNRSLFLSLLALSLLFVLPACDVADDDDDTPVIPVDDAPTISAVADQTIDEDGATANLADANLTGADLTGAELAGVSWSDTTCPDGSNSDAVGGTCANNLAP